MSAAIGEYSHDLSCSVEPFEEEEDEHGKSASCLKHSWARYKSEFARTGLVVFIKPGTSVVERSVIKLFKSFLFFIPQF